MFCCLDQSNNTTEDSEEFTGSSDTDFKTLDSNQMNQNIVKRKSSWCPVQLPTPNSKLKTQTPNSKVRPDWSDTKFQQPTTTTIPPHPTANFSDTSRGPTTKCYTFLETSHQPQLGSKLRCKYFANFFLQLYFANLIKNPKYKTICKTILWDVRIKERMKAREKVGEKE